MRLLSSLRVRLMLLVAVAMLPAFGLVAYSGLQQREDQREAARDQAALLSQTINARQGQYVEGARQFLGLLAGLARSLEPGEVDPASCQQSLAAVLEENPRYANVGLADANGTIFCNGLSAELVDASFRSWFQRASETGAFAVGDYQIGTITGVASVNFGYPVLDGSGRVTSVVFAALDLSWLNEAAGETPLPEGALLSIVDRSGVILARHPDSEGLVGEQIGDEGGLEPGGEVVISEAPGVDGVERLWAASPLGDASAPEAYVRVGIPTAGLYAAANETLTRNVLLLAGVTAVAVAAAWFAGDGLVVRPVRSVLVAAQRMRAGDLSARSEVSSAGELGELGRTFDGMAASLERRTRDRERAEAELERRAEELARSNAELEQFAYVASHDLQEPLRMVASYTQLLAQRYGGRLDADADEFIGYAVDGARRMQTLINDLLAFSRVGTRGVEPAPTESERALEASLRNLEAAIAESGAAVERGRLPRVLADESQLTQVFQNLIGNALKFHDGGPPRIHVSAREEGGRVVFSVRDEGIGIAPEYQERIFEVFRRLHTREDYPGTGIGLAVCKKVVERHGGSIWVRSEPGEGATFSFTLAAAPEQAAA